MYQALVWGLGDTALDINTTSSYVILRGQILPLDLSHYGLMRDKSLLFIDL